VNQRTTSEVIKGGIMMRRRYSIKMLASLIICALVLIRPGAAHADTIFSNFGPGFSYNTALGNPVGDGLDGSGFDYAEGDGFIAGISGSLRSVMLALSCAVCPATGSLQLNLTRNGANQPGAALESFSIPGGSLGSLGNNNPVFVLNSVFHPFLVSGTQYWLTVSGPATSAVAWNLNTTEDSSLEAISGDGGISWFVPSGLTPGAFAVTTVPEPGTVWLLMTGMIGLGGVQLHRLRKQK
jgi:hypothetical protein